MSREFWLFCGVVAALAGLHGVQPGQAECARCLPELPREVVEAGEVAGRR